MSVSADQSRIAYGHDQLVQALEKGNIQAVGDLLHWIASIDPTAAKRILDVLNDGLKARGIR